MALCIFLLSALLCLALGCLVGLPLPPVILFSLLLFLGLNIMYVIFWVIVASTVNDKKPLEKQSSLCRYGCASIAGWLCAWGRVRVHVSGRDLLPRYSRFLFVCNHRSMFDPITMAAVLDDYNISFISKPSNLKIPFIGPLAYGAASLPLNRENDREALKSILLAADYMKRDFCSIAVYPEGTRSKTSELLPFHAGSFKAAQKANVPLVIAVVRGTENVSKNFPFRRTHVFLDILEVLSSEKVKSMNTQSLAAYSHSLMESALHAHTGEVSV